MTERELWKAFFKKYISCEDFKLWDLDTDIYKIIKNFYDKLKDIYIENKNKIEVTFSHKNDKKTSYYSLFYDQKNITPSNMKLQLSWSAIRQYLEVLNCFDIIKYNAKPKNNKSFILYLNDTSFLSKDENYLNIFLLNKIISINPFIQIKKETRNLWFSIFLYSLYKFYDKELVLEMIDSFSYSKQILRKKESPNQVIEELKNTYEKFSLFCFKKYFENNSNIIIQNLFLLLNEEIKIKDSSIENKYLTNLFKQIKAKRNLLSYKLKQERILEKSKETYSDLIDILTNIKTLDVAHIVPVYYIVNQILIESNNINFNKEKVENLLKMVDDSNNLLLIPHNYHYLYDKGYLILNINGIFQINESISNETFKTFGIKNNAQIKNNLLTKKMIEYINESNKSRKTKSF